MCGGGGGAAEVMWVGGGEHRVNNENVCQCPWGPEALGLRASSSARPRATFSSS